MSKKLEFEPYAFYKVLVVCCGAFFLCILILYTICIKRDISSLFLFCGMLSIGSFSGIIICWKASKKMTIIFGDDYIHIITKQEKKTYAYEDFPYCFYCSNYRGATFIILAPEDYGMDRLRKMIDMSWFNLCVVTDGAIILPTQSATNKELRVINKIINEKNLIVKRRSFGGI